MDIEQKKKDCRFAIEHLMAGIWDASKDKDTEICYDLRDKCVEKIEQALKEAVEAERKEITEIIERLKLECDVVRCDCGESIKDWDICVLINQCCALQREKCREIKNKLKYGRP